MRATTDSSRDQATNAPLKEGPACDAPIMVVDDSRVAQRIAGNLILKGTGRAVVFANNGRQALALLGEIRPSLILTDIQMPEMGGIELVEAVRAGHPGVPVVLMTAYGSESAAMQALAAGAANYVPKKNLATDLVDTLRRLLAIVASDQRKRRVLSCQTSRMRSFVVDNDPDLIPPLIDLVREDLDSFAFGDETTRIRISVALQESLANALYHGNLECSSDLRQEDEQLFYDLAARRRDAEPYRSRRIHMESRVDRDEARLVIRDDGPGFDLAALDKPFDPEDLMRVGGRGMVLIRTFMDKCLHNNIGNEIIIIKYKYKCNKF